MQLRELVAEIREATPERQRYAVVLVEREDNQSKVAIIPIGHVRVDEGEAHFWPRSLAGSEAPGFENAMALRDWGASQAGDLACYSIQQKLELGDGGTATLNIPLITSVWFDDRQELWLVPAPAERWPASWWSR